MRLFSPLLLIGFMVNLGGCDKNIEQTAEKKALDRTLCAFAQGECVKTIANIELSLSLSPKHAPSEKPLTLKLLTSKPIENVQIQLEGRDMFMGIIPVNIRETGKNAYEGNLIYGSCSSGHMVWRTFIRFSEQQNQYSVFFDFLADNPS